MKRIIGMMVLAVALMVPSASFAEGDQIGVYVAPKFVYGYTMMNSVKGVGLGAGDPEPTTYRVGSKDDNVFGGSLAIGYDFDKRFRVPIRTELEYTIFSEAEAKRNYSYGEFFPDEDLTRRQTFRIQTLFLNAYWDINTGTQFTPYVGAGIGAAFIKTEGNSSGSNPIEGSWDMDFGSKTVTNFAWNVGAGLGYDITNNWTVDLGYRFVGLGSVKTATYHEGGEWIRMKSSGLYQHQVSLGIRYTF